MRPHARLAAAAEVLAEIESRHRPASEALADWGKAHRFAGSADRAAIGNLVFDVLRKRLSLAAIMASDEPRALVIAAARKCLDLAPDAVAALADGSPHALAELSDTERVLLAREVPPDAPAHVRADIPEWLMPSFERALGAGAVAEGAALAERAPVDLRANALKADREKVLKAMARFDARETPYSPVGVRVLSARGMARQPNVEAEPGHAKGWFEVQDEGSQIAALMTGVGPRLQVLDLCAGAGGKTLALAGAMRNTGQIYAYDASRQQLRPIFERLKRAGARNVQVMPAGDEAALATLGPRFDVVLVDAPCTGSGVWRRRPDAKWRVKPANLKERQAEQQRVLELGGGLVKPGGRLVYVTCSMLPEENTDTVAAFVKASDNFAIEPFAESWRRALPGEPPPSADGRTDTLLLSPARHGTDGFFVATLARAR
jgi:16S rRNA (cytosine967-C5)-methyltransferase